MICFIVVILFGKCYKEPTYEALIKCYYSENGVDKGAPAPGCIINIGDKDAYLVYPNWVSDTMLRKDVIADATGQYKTTFRYEALLEVRAKIDSIRMEYVEEADTSYFKEVPVPYFGKGKLKLVQNEVTTLEVLLIKNE